MRAEPGREIYRKHREHIRRHLLREDRREYSLEALRAFIIEFTSYKHGIRFYCTTVASPTATAGNRSSDSAQRPSWKKLLG